MSLIESLKEKQGDKTQVEFARELGISQSVLSRIYRSERRIGRRVAAKIAERFPLMAFDLAGFLLAPDMTTGPVTDMTREQRGNAA